MNSRVNSVRRAHQQSPGSSRGFQIAQLAHSLVVGGMGLNGASNDGSFLTAWAGMEPPSYLEAASGQEPGVAMQKGSYIDAAESFEELLQVDFEGTFSPNKHVFLQVASQAADLQKKFKKAGNNLNVLGECMSTILGLENDANSRAFSAMEEKMQNRLTSLLGNLRNDIVMDMQKGSYIDAAKSFEELLQVDFEGTTSPNKHVFLQVASQAADLQKKFKKAGNNPDVLGACMSTIHGLENDANSRAFSAMEEKMQNRLTSLLSNLKNDIVKAEKAAKLEKTESKPKFQRTNFLPNLKDGEAAEEGSQEPNRGGFLRRFFRRLVKPKLTRSASLPNLTNSEKRGSFSGIKKLFSNSKSDEKKAKKNVGGLIKFWNRN